MRPYSVALTLLLVAVLKPSASAAAPTPLPEILGYLGSSSSAPMIALRWQEPDGKRLQGWYRIGQKAGDFTLTHFDEVTHVLTLTGPDGRSLRLALADGQVQPVLTDTEFERLLRFMGNRNRQAEAPVLSREQARAFFLRLIRQRPEPPDVEFTLDLDFKTVPRHDDMNWQEAQANARAKGRLILAAISNGKTEVYECPLRPFPTPEPMTRNLTEADWDELAFLDAILSIKNGIAGRK